jgi:hypothetical protein
LLFIGRTFNNYYLVWPLSGALAAVLLGLGEHGSDNGAEPSALRAGPSVTALERKGCEHLEAIVDPAIM